MICCITYKSKFISCREIESPQAIGHSRILCVFSDKIPFESVKSLRNQMLLSQKLLLATISHSKVWTFSWTCGTVNWVVQVVLTFDSMDEMLVWPDSNESWWDGRTFLWRSCCFLCTAFKKVLTLETFKYFDSVILMFNNNCSLCEVKKTVAQFP